MSDAQPAEAVTASLDGRSSRAWGRRLIAAADAAAVVDAIAAAGGRLALDDLQFLSRSRAGAVACELESRGVATTAGDGVTLRPRPAGTVLAVDVGGTKTMVALTDLYGNVLEEIVTPTAQQGLADQIAAVRDELTRRAGGDAGPVLAGCVGIPATYDPVSDRAWSAGNLPELYEMNPAAALERALGMPVAVAQDVRLAAVGERWRGRAKGHDDYVVLCIGTGVAMGIVLGGEVFGGARGGAGEICYLPLGNDPFAAEHRDRGAFEDAVSGPAVARRFAIEAGAEQCVGDARVVFDAAAAGDPTAERVLDRQAELLAMGISVIVSTLDPQLVVLGGGLGSNPALLAPVRHHAQRLAHEPPAIEPSPLAHRGPLHGAIAVALANVPQSA
jgi:predicted NBD/HSP70 family sugar kinase